MYLLKSKIIIVGFLLSLLAYLALYTWNWRTGYLDELVSYTGMEFVGWILYPGDYIKKNGIYLWQHYIDLLEVKKENDQLQSKIKQLRLESMKLRKEANEATRLRNLLGFSPPPGWSFIGARVIAHKVGPQAVLESLFIDKGERDGLGRDQPVITPKGLVGRVFRSCPNFSSVLLLTDPNNRIPVLGSQTRTKGILIGQGPDPDTNLKVKFVSKNARLYEGELLLTSGMSGIFPKGVPVAKVVSVDISEFSLFKEVKAEQVINLKRLEEVLVIKQKTDQDLPIKGQWAP